MTTDTDQLARAFGITRRSTYHLELDFATDEARNDEQVILQARDYLYQLDMEAHNWIIEVVGLSGPTGWPVVRFGHSDQEYVIELAKFYDNAG